METSELLVFANLFCLSCCETATFSSSKCRSRVQPASSLHPACIEPAHTTEQQHGFYHGNVLPHFICQSQSYSVGHSTVHRHLPTTNTCTLLPSSCPDLQPSSLHTTVHLSTSLTLSISSNCSLHPDPILSSLSSSLATAAD